MKYITVTFFPSFLFVLYCNFCLFGVNVLCTRCPLFSRFTLFDFPDCASRRKMIQSFSRPSTGSFSAAGVWSFSQFIFNPSRGKKKEEFDKFSLVFAQICRIFAGFSQLGPGEMYRVPAGYREVTREGPRSLHFRGNCPIPRLQNS